MLYIRVTAHADKLRRDLLRRKDQVYNSGGNRGAWHAIVLGGLRLLGDRDPAHRFDFAQPDGPVGGGPGKDDSNRPVLGVLGQRPKKKVDRHELPVVPGTGNQVQLALLDPHVSIGRDDVNMVGLEQHAITDLYYGKSRRAAEKMRKNTLMLGGQMLNQHDRHAGRFLKSMQELSKRLESTG